jgi:hypothetical protein
MNSSGEAAEQVVRLYLEGVEVAAKVTGEAARNITALLLATLKQPKQTKGKTRLTKMLKSGKELKVFSIPQKDLEKFTKSAKNYGVLYTVLKDKTSNNKLVPVDIIARAEDASKIQRIIERFELSNVDKATIVSQSEKELSAHAEKEKQVPLKDKSDIVIEKAMKVPNQKDEAEKSNPKIAKTEKDPPSEQNYLKTQPYHKEGVAKKPSVREKLDDFKRQAEKQKELDKVEPMKNVGVKVEDRSVSKTVNQQPIKKKPIKER